MTSYSPRIYIYKITFDEVLYYYYGVHKEKVFGEKYLGTPVTHKWCWEFYTPKKQILELFPYTDEGWKEAQEIEKRLIQPFYNTDKLCLNESCGGKTSLEVCSKAGKKCYEKRKGIHSLTKEERIEIGKRMGRKNYKEGKGIHSQTKEEKVEIGRKLYEERKGIHSLTKEERIEIGKRVGQKTYELGIGIHSLTTEERIEIGKRMGRKNYKEGKGIFSKTKDQIIEYGKKGGKKTSSQRWQCTITGYISTPGPLAKYQRSRGIEISNRIRIV